MDERRRATNPERLIGEQEFDTTLRPPSLKDFVGQEKLKSNLAVFIQAALERNEPLDHVMFFGPPGLGKTTLANIIAKELGSDIRTTSGPALERPADLAGILTNLNERDVLFIDEIHRLNRVIEEYLYPAMEDFSLDIIIDKGANARTVQLKLPKFTLIGATTRAGLITSPLRARFGVSFRLDFYEPEELKLIIHRSATILGIQIDAAAALEVARRSRGTPRIANRLLRRVRDFAQIANEQGIRLDLAKSSLLRMDVDEGGFDEMDKRIILSIIDKFAGGPVGLNTLAMAIGEESDTIEEVYEPYLIQQGFINRTPRGRVATELAYAHFNRNRKTPSQRTLFDE
ncbi:Holliday junction branch migration DNA helicase RuvB [candidate division KSB1 bacterium]|nr:Holliday junction branch migration DNA helicase RuvB [candidate division KSB1 bacterium]RQW07518.1 MAG: Holliday junction branch migration DNA helicase RuvB [candidate division KSB1 bacterium]